MSALIDALKLADRMAAVLEVFEAQGSDKTEALSNYKRDRAALAAAEAQPKPVAVYMGHRSTPEGTKEFWGVADTPMLMGTKLYAAPVAQPVVPQGWKLAAFPTDWTPGGDWFKNWCASWFGPDADDDHIRKAVVVLLAAAPAAPAAQPQPATIKESSASAHLADLVSALNGAYISSWQSTAAWQKQLDAARDYLADHGIGSAA
jgi:hypothetical protein